MIKNHFTKRQTGFSLVEMAIVLIILGFVLSALLLPLQAQRQQIAQSQTENVLASAKQALLGYAQQYGRLPCPATTTSNGVEDQNPAGSGTCSQQAGFLPAATLGIQPTDSKGFAIDAWNNPIRYAVTQTNMGGAATPDFTTSSDLSNVGIPLLNPDLTVCNDSSSSSCSATAYLTNNAVAVIFSTGKNFGLTAGVDETSNLLSATIKFYSRTPTAATASPNKEFDDMVTWISPYVLYNSMIQAGQLH
jgi:prepilin-type N-terminal cleavage/methylation domain-containing protein